MNDLETKLTAVSEEIQLFNSQITDLRHQVKPSYESVTKGAASVQQVVLSNSSDPSISDSDINYDNDHELSYQVQRQKKKERKKAKRANTINDKPQSKPNVVIPLVSNASVPHLPHQQPSLKD